MEQTKIHTTDAFHNRKTQIEDCLIKKLATTPYSSISILDICNDVGVSRRSFYHYFADKDACLDSVIDRYFRKYMLEVAAIPKDKTSREKAIALMRIWKDGGSKVLDMLAKNQLLDVLTIRAVRFAKEEEFVFAAPFYLPLNEADEDILNCYVASDMALLMGWYRRGFDTSPEEMAEKYMQVIRKI